MQNADIIQNYIMRDMSEGVIAIGFDGIINYLNPAAEGILDRSAKELVGRPCAVCFFDIPENDGFTQMILEAIYDRSSTHERVVDFFTGKVQKQLHIKTSFLKNEAEAIGIVCVLTDVSELAELRDALKAMERIRSMNTQLELRNRLLSETFGRFLSDEIVRELLETPDGLMLGGKKRELTVMMSDLRGFTAMSERMEPQKLLDMLNHYLGQMTEVIQRNSGTIVEFIGDGIMVIFGAPVESRLHAEQAVCAAVEMQRRMEDVNAWNVSRGYPCLQMGIGIHTGEMIVGNIGSEKRTKYGVVGSDVNLAGRIESYTVGGQILISPQTRQAVGPALDINDELRVFPKGLDHALTLSSVTGIGAPYHLSFGQTDAAPQTLAVPVSVRFSRISEKHVDSDTQAGFLTALSETAAVLSAAELPEVFDNLRLDIGDGLFAKVLSREADGCLLRFTSLPASFREWYADTCSK